MMKLFPWHVPWLLLAQPPRAVLRCASLSTSSSSHHVTLFFERPARRWLLRSGRKQRVAIEDDGAAARPLRALRSTLARELLDPRVDPSAHLAIAHGKRELSSDADVSAVLRSASEHGAEAQLRVLLTPEAEAALPPPPDEDAAAAHPAASDELLQMVSAFVFHAAPASAERVEALVEGIEAALRECGVLGTAYVAPEGVNCQLAVPLSQLEAVRARLAALDAPLASRINRGEVVAPSTRPFRKLVVKARAQVLTDGLGGDGDDAASGGALGGPLDWRRAGVDVPPEEWDAALAAAARDDALLLDCRNDYESEAGSFDGAEPLGTAAFSESWPVLRARLAGVPKDTPILTFCTGGIRCVKTNAFLEQELGFTNTKKLRDGIVGYLRHKREQQASGAAEAPADAADAGAVGAWRGSNFVFDKRELVAPADEGGGVSDEDDDE